RRRARGRRGPRRARRRARCVRARRYGTRGRPRCGPRRLRGEIRTLSPSRGEVIHTRSDAYHAVVGSNSSEAGGLGSAAALLNALADAPGGPAASRGPLEPGQLVAGKYKVVRTIGAGGMGVVYLVRDLRLDRDVALKLGMARSAAALARV